MTGEGMNDGRGSLSSMAYVDSVLGQGPFAALPAKAVAKCEKHASLVHSGEIQRLLQLSFDGPGRPAAAIQPLEDPDGWQVLARSESIRTVEEADEDSWSQVSRSEAGPLPLPALGPERAAMMGLLQADLARDYDLAKKDHAKAALARKRELLRMEEEWNQLSWFQRALRSALPPFFGRQSWEDQADFELAKYSHLLRRAEFLRNLEEFLSTARPDQVDKFFQLFQQELGPLD
jgi:hypothetical protein